MPSKKSLLASLLVLALLCGIYGIQLATSEPVIDEDLIYAQTGMSSEAMTLTELDMRTIMFLTVDCEHGDTMELEYTVQGWKVKGNHDIPLDDALVEEILNPLCAVKSDRLLSEDPAAKAEYGLEPARFKVTLTDSKGQSYTYNIGDKHPTTYKYYFNIEGEDKIYTVPTGVGMNLEEHHSVGSLIKSPYFPSPSVDVTESIVIETGDDHRIEVIHMPEGSETCWSDDYKWFFKSENGSLLPMDEATFSYFTNVIDGMGFLQTVDYCDEPAELEKYGLTEDKQHKMSITYESAQRGMVTDVIYIGLGENGSTYARIDGSWVVGSIVNKYDYFGFGYEKYQARDFFKLDLDTVDSMTVTLGDMVSVIEAERTLEVTSDGKEKILTDFTLGGKTLDSTAVTAWFNGMRNVAAEDLTAETPAGSPYMTITFDRNTANHKEMTLKIWEHDSNFYISEFAGIKVLVNKNDVKTIVTNLTAALESTAQ